MDGLEIAVKIELFDFLIASSAGHMHLEMKRVHKLVRQLLILSVVFGM